MSWQLALGVLDHRAAGVLREPLVPPGVEQGVPRRPRPHRHEPDDAAGEPRRRARRAGLRPRGLVHAALLAHQRGPVRGQPRDRAHLGEVLPDRRVRRRRRHRGDHRVRRLPRRAATSSPSAPSPRSCSTSTTCSSRSSSSASSTTPCSRRAPRCRRSSACSTRRPTIAERPGAVDLPAPTARSRSST